MKTLKTFRPTLIAVCIILMTAGTAKAQTGIGLRLGTDPGITVKHTLNSGHAIEGILHTGYRGLLVTGLYEWQKPIGDTRGLSAYIGAGGHLGVFNRWTVYRYNNHGYYHEVVYADNTPSIGLDGVLGLEYDFRGAPFNIGLDLKPTIDFYGGNVYSFVDGALSVRFVF